MTGLVLGAQVWLAAVALWLPGPALVALGLYGVGVVCAVLPWLRRPFPSRDPMRPRRHALRAPGGSDAVVRRAVEVERTRLRHDLHDGLGPLLCGIGLGVAALSDLLGARDLHAERTVLARIGVEVSHAVAEVRRLVEALPPAAVAELGLVEALRAHAGRVPPTTDVEVVVSVLPALPRPVEAAVYRIVTESLTNVVRHADARHATVSLAARRHRLVVTVADDGRGLGDAPAGVGMTSIRRRAEAVGGTLRVRTAPGRGTELRVRVPLP
ncbi:sensor histidine kinase [Streptomyces sp. NPDC090106]|uniref:sensor histidine kinase n=1 Tax=Streptomyces sp. NPDC090106 TaxID=3365946 RepID=UPI0037FBD0CF